MKECFVRYKIVLLAASLMLLSACNTLTGMGKDFSSLGKGMSDVFSSD
jgi:predicted small secreted protein